MIRNIKILFGAIALLYLVGTSYQMFLFLDYQSNKEEITEEFCINKDKPEMHCDGSCHLKKELKSIPLNPTRFEKKSEDSPRFSLVSFDTFNQLSFSSPLDVQKIVPLVEDYYSNTYSGSWHNEMVDPPDFV